MYLIDTTRADRLYTSTYLIYSYLNAFFKWQKHVYNVNEACIYKFIKLCMNSFYIDYIRLSTHFPLISHGHRH